MRSVEHGNDTLGALEGETLRARVFGVQELLKDLRVGELRENSDLLFTAQVDVVSGELHSIAEPVASLALLEEGVFDPDRP